MTDNNQHNKPNNDNLVTFPVPPREEDNLAGLTWLDASRPTHALRQYIRWLGSSETLTDREYTMVRKALRHVVRRVRTMPVHAVEAVRDELRDGSLTLHDLAEQELLHWRVMLQAGYEPIKRIHFEHEYARFVTSCDQDDGRTVVPFSPEQATNLPDYVPPHVGRAEAYFLLCLRMARKYLEHNAAHRKLV